MVYFFLFLILRKNSLSIFDIFLAFKILIKCFGLNINRLEPKIIKKLFQEFPVDFQSLQSDRSRLKLMV